MAKVRARCRQVNTNHPLDVLLQRLNPLLRGWTTLLPPGSVQRDLPVTWTPTSGAGWLDGSAVNTAGISRKDFRSRYCDGGWWPRGQDTELFHTGVVRTTRYRYRGSVIPSPWPLPAEQRIG